MDVSEELANRICGQLDNFFNYKQFCELPENKGDHTDPHQPGPFFTLCWE